MRIELLVGSEDPLIFPLKSSKVIIGSGDNCDVVLDASGISRKHIAVITEGDQYFVIDQGSTNGSFLNEERLVPGKKTEFTSFFPVRLGDNVLLSLLSDQEDIDYTIPVPKERTSPDISLTKAREDSTTVIKFNDLKKTSTEKLVLERNQKREAVKKTVVTPPPKPGKKLGIVQISAILLVVVAGYYNFVHQKLNKDDEPVAQMGKVIEVTKVEQPKVVSDAVPENKLPKRETLPNLLNDIKCSTDVEKYLCNNIPSAKEGLYGATQVGLTYKVVVDGSLYLNEARKFIQVPKDTSPEALESYERLVRKTAAFIFFMRYLKPLNEELLGDNPVVIGFFITNEGNHELQFVVAFYPKVFNREKPGMKESDIFMIKNNGEVALKTFESHFTIY